MNSSSGIGILSLYEYYLCRPIKCPLGSRLEILAWFYWNVYMKLFCIHILERKETFQIFIKLHSMLNINHTAPYPYQNIVNMHRIHVTHWNKRLLVWVMICQSHWMALIIFYTIPGVMNQNEPSKKKVLACLYYTT
jgi:predicted CDP-diglyceride synthetase/phosphatidate cytidylyltransferase